MDDGEHDSLRAVLHADHTVLVATTLATLFLAGSALICRSGRRLSFSLNHQGYSLVASGAPQTDSDAKKQKLLGQTVSADESAKNNARSKERRRRGKDPLKDILKGSGKKLKLLSVSSRDPGDSATSASTSAIASPLPLTQIQESGNDSTSVSGSQRSVSVSTASTSRSVSASARDPAAPISMTDIHPREQTTEHTDATVTALSTRKPRGRTPNPIMQSTAFDADASPDVGAPPRGVAENPETLPGPGDSPTTDTTNSSGSTVHLASSSSHTPLATVSSSASSPVYYPPAPNPWDWDGQGPSASSSSSTPGAGNDSASVAYRKPPRFHSSTSGGQASGSSSEIPTLNSLATSAGTSTGTGSGTPRPAPTPRTNSTASTFTTPNSRPNSTGRASPASAIGEVAAQTQLASLRGALEAARLREEKTKGELERFAKDLEMMRWENGAWRRREVELQAQVNHLMHQLQAYAALFHAQAQAQSRHAPQHNGSPRTGSPSTHSHPQSPASYPGSAQSPTGFPNGYPSPGYPFAGLLSPLSPGQPQPQPYFTPYPMPPPPSMQLPPAPQHQQPQSHQQQPTLYSMLFPNAGSASGSGSGSGSASGKSGGRGGGGSAKGSVSGSSVGSGSGSPDLVGSPAPAPGPSLVDRGRRRTRIKTAEARLGVSGPASEGDMSDSWVGVEHEHDGEPPLYESEYGHERQDPEEDDGEYGSYEYGYHYEEDDGGLSDVLADAIFKRPESIGVRSRPKTQREKERLREADTPPPPTEFTFPSLTDFGPGVHLVGAGYLEKPPPDASAEESVEEPVTELALQTEELPTPLAAAPLENPAPSPNPEDSSASESLGEEDTQS
ncbi:hypothetical protein R3P38DRAFT_2903752 [Favolaschia claudopus]|uniref:Uncharacterized protein n=1 Tax=Favolaschia claudopus TaxID=2862362 RepID=A0AAW0CFV9_9AGAR